MTMQSLHRVWLQCHRWTALFLGWLLVSAGITGSLLVVARPVDRLLHPGFFVAAPHEAGLGADRPQAHPGADADTEDPAAGVSLERLRKRLAAEFGPKAAFTFRPPQEVGETLQVLVRSQWRGTLFLNPRTGAEQGRRGENEGFFTLLYGLHSALLLDQTGKAVLACAALSYLFLLLTGVALWWPRRWPPSLRMEFGKGRTRALFDLHRTGGAVLALFLAVSVGTGAYLAWRPIGSWISWLAGAPRVVAPSLPAQSTAAAILPLDDLAARAQAVFPDGRIGYFLYNPAPNRPLAIRFRLPDDPHPNGRSTVWLDPRNGAVLAAHRWSDLDPGTRVNSYVYPLHTGELGGVALQVVVGVLGAMLGVLGISGLWLWWRRSATRRAARRLRC